MLNADCVGGSGLFQKFQSETVKIFDKIWISIAPEKDSENNYL